MIKNYIVIYEEGNKLKMPLMFIACAKLVVYEGYKITNCIAIMYDN